MGSSSVSEIQNRPFCQEAHSPEPRLEYVREATPPSRFTSLSLLLDHTFVKVVLVLFVKEKTWRGSESSLQRPGGRPGTKSRGQVSVQDTRDVFLLKERKTVGMLSAISSRNGLP